MDENPRRTRPSTIIQALSYYVEQKNNWRARLKNSYGPRKKGIFQEGEKLFLSYSQGENLMNSFGLFKCERSILPWVQHLLITNKSECATFQVQLFYKTILTLVLQKTIMVSDPSLGFFFSHAGSPQVNNFTDSSSHLNYSRFMNFRSNEFSCTHN